MKKEEFDRIYPALAHALQSGVMCEMQLDTNDVCRGNMNASASPTSPKMLRTGVNMAMVEASAVAKLLMAAGVFTEEQYRQALIDGLREEVARYEADLLRRHDVAVTLA